MILDRLENADAYAVLHPLFAAAFAALRRLSAASDLSPGRRPLDAVTPEAWVVVEIRHARGRAESPLEAHRRFIDIQLTVSGDEEIGWRPLAECVNPRGDFDAGRDIGFFADPPLVWLPVPAGYFAVFFPEDAHAPLAGRGALRKLIAKVPVSVAAKPPTGPFR